MVRGSIDGKPFIKYECGKVSRDKQATSGVDMHWIWFIIVGAVVGALGRLLHRGRDPMGWLMTVAIGVVAMIVAAAISSGWLAFVIGVVIAAILVAIISRYRGGQRPLARV